MTRQISIFCPECGERSTINKVSYTGVTGAALTCTCNNHACGHVAVWECGFAHTIKSPLTLTNATQRDITASPKQISKFVMCCQNCGQRAIIRKTERQHPQSYTFYCACTNKDCLHRFTASFNFKTALVPGAIASGRLIQDLIKYIPASERENIIRVLRDAGGAVS